MSNRGKHEYPSTHIITADEALAAWREHQSSLHCFGCETVFRFLAQKSAEDRLALQDLGDV